uniref:Hydroxcinnamoyl-CoA quinate/shikimate hydroxycinnamoyltransferase n=1 Tax=Rhizophora mucronata TaxID=61149 RepID=A0A2P2JLA1_RHIMU
MLIRRFIGRVLFAAAKSETSTANTTANAASMMSAKNPLEEFFEVDRSQDEAKPIVYGTISPSANFYKFRFFSSLVC